MNRLDAFYGPNAGYILELYDAYTRDPESVDPDIRRLFAEWMPEEEIVASAPAPAAPAIERVARVSHLARTIRARGHLAARLDPLGDPPPGDPGLDVIGADVTEADLRDLPASIVDGPIALQTATAGQAIEALRGVYCATTGYDYSHVQVAEERAWLRDAVESGRFRQPLDTAIKRRLLERLTDIEAFEVFLHRTLPGQKRFSIEGTDMVVPMLDQIIGDAAGAGTCNVVMGMAHRGRLNVLAHVLEKPYSRIFSEFQRATSGPTSAPSEHFAHYGWTGDVKYHLGAKKTLTEGGTVRVHITLAPNPSHLEFVNPVIQGMTRALQETRDAPGFPIQDVESALAILIHGDAAFPGEGIVAETLNLSRLRGYTAGGTIHIIANNQLGFTTEPGDARSTLYASDLAKGFEIPIVHVNADDPEACLAAAKLAHAYRERFHKDFLIDLVGYRRWGHNEGDEPAFTQPVMYELVRQHPTVRELWARALDREGTMLMAESMALFQSALRRLQELYPDADKEPPAHEVVHPVDDTANTALPAATLAAYNTALVTLPPGFHLHPKLDRLIQARRSAFEPGGLIDWAHAEALAFASLLAEGTPIRLAGQDVERGTFSQRHLVLSDAVTGERFFPLHALQESHASFAIYNSPLSESGALGFEYGYSSQANNVLVVWEAQYGDFANAGQVIIDQFVAAARAKWQQFPWLVLLLPHGYEGQGPEHSSGRLERYLQLAGDNNLRVANCTTAAQYFHLLRRQVALREEDAVPLVLMAPKSLLRHPLAASPLDELVEGCFHAVIDDPDTGDHRNAVTRLVLCTGKVYVDVVSSPARRQTERVAIARVEQLYPFPAADLVALINSYPNLRELMWLQEEPRNMGAWTYMSVHLRDLIVRDLIGQVTRVDYIGRPDRASPAEGSVTAHQREQARIVSEAFSGLQGPASPVQGVKQHAG